MSYKYYDLAILKYQKQKNKVELFLAKKNRERKKIESEIKELEERKCRLKKIFEKEGRITNELLIGYQQLNLIDIHQLEARLKSIDSNVLAIKKEYLKLKHLIEKFEEKKMEKIKEMKKEKLKKEEKRILEDFIAKKTKEMR